MLSVLRALHISLATCARSSFLPVFWPMSNFFFVCTHGLCQKKRVCLPLALCSAQPIWSEFTSVVVSVWTSFWRRDFPLKSSEMLYKYWDLLSSNPQNKNRLSLMRKNSIGHTIFVTYENYRMIDQKPDTPDILFTKEKNRVGFSRLSGRPCEIIETECLERSLPAWKSAGKNVPQFVWTKKRESAWWRETEHISSLWTFFDRSSFS